MITLKQFSFSPFEEATFVLSDQTGECIIVDAGCYTREEREALKHYIAGAQLKPTLLLNTHGHVDHLLGSRFVTDTWNVPFAMHKADSYLLENAVTQGQMFGLRTEAPPAVDRWVEEGEEILFGNSGLSVLHVPGHSPGSLLFYCSEQAFLIAGDVLFAGSIGRTDLYGGNYDTLIDGIYAKVLVLPPETTVYPGHGPKTTIERELAGNPFLLRLGRV